MIKIDKNKVTMEGTGIQLQSELTLGIVNLIETFSKEAKGVISKKDIARIILRSIKQAVLHIIGE